MCTLVIPRHVSTQKIRISPHKSSPYPHLHTHIHIRAEIFLLKCKQHFRRGETMNFQWSYNVFEWYIEVLIATFRCNEKVFFFCWCCHCRVVLVWFCSTSAFHRILIFWVVVITYTHTHIYMLQQKKLNARCVRDFRNNFVVVSLHIRVVYWKDAEKSVCYKYTLGDRNILVIVEMIYPDTRNSWCVPH